MIKELLQEILEIGILTKENFVGCTADQIKEVEKKCGFVLPMVYKEFLYFMGRRADYFFPSSGGLYPEILSYKEEALNITLNDDMTGYLIEVPKDAFVFYTYQSEQFSFFCLNEGDDPPIYYYKEMETSFNLIYNKLSDFFTDRKYAAIVNPLVYKINRINLSANKEIELNNILSKVYQLLLIKHLPEEWKEILINVENLAKIEIIKNKKLILLTALSIIAKPY